MSHRRIPTILRANGRYTCQQCGEHFDREYEPVGNPGAAPKYCSQVCGNRTHRARGTRHTCYTCGTLSARGEVVKRGGRLARTRYYCSIECRELHRDADTRDYPATSSRLPADHWALRYGKSSRWNAAEHLTPIRYFTCVVCDTLCITGSGSGSGNNSHKRKTCSPECSETRRRENKYNAKARRRARKRDAFVADVDRSVIFERDKWRCQLCSEKLDMDTVAPHPRSPTIDHVIPLSKGGTHEPANVQAAHLSCNMIKGNRVSAQPQPQLV